METQSTGKYWLLTLFWFAITVGLLILRPEWFWVTLPFFLTYLVMAFRAI